MKIVLTGGGTGGHIYPAISVAQALREAEPEIELLFVGSSHGPEGKIAADAGLEFRAIPSSPLTKSISVRNAVSLARLTAGVFRARRILKDFGPDVAIGTGGYTTAAVLVAQRSLSGRIVIHEQNAVPGRTNKWLARIADRVCVTFEGSAKSFPKDKVVVTGLPIRRDFANLPEKSEARRTLHLAQDLFTILVVGGSQGAKSLNELIIGAWPAIDDSLTQVLHQVGQRNLEEARRLFATAAPSPGGEGRGEGAETPSPGGEGRGEGAETPSPGGEGRGEGAETPSPGREGWGEGGARTPSPLAGEGWGEGGKEQRYRIEAYVDMPTAMAAADLVVGRSGASTVAEITACGLPSILIPYPYGIALEQKANAGYLVEHDAAILCEQATCTSEKLAGIIKDLRADPARLSAMASASKALGKPDAAQSVAEVAIRNS